MTRRRGYAAFGLTVAALSWAAVLFVAAFTVPVYGDGETLVGLNGPDVLPGMAAPMLIAATVWFALHRRCTRGDPVYTRLAETLVALLLAFCIFAMFSIGAFVLPLVLLLLLARLFTPAPGTESRAP